MNVVFVEPFFPPNQRHFARALAEVGATVIGVGESPAEKFDEQLKGWLHNYEQVSSVTNVEAMTRQVRSAQDRLWVDRIEATIEAHTLATAKVREACAIPGTSVRTAWLCRDVLEAMRTRWISPQFISTNRIDTAPEYAELREMGRYVNAALGIGTSATHMEWFFGPKGLKFSEIGCRPPGVGAWDPYSAGNEIDVYREWAMAIVHGETGSTPSRRYASGIVALRPEQDGRITGYTGAEEMNQQYGEWVIDAHLPSPGTATQPVEAGYMANAYIRMRHPDYDTLRGMLDAVGQMLHVYAS